MRPVKLLVALTAAIVATALIGASSASATTTVICKENVLVCPESKQIVLAGMQLLATNTKLVSSLGTVKCEFASLKAEILHLASPLQLHLKELSYTNCKLGVAKCKVETTHFGLPHLLKTGTNLGEFLDEASGGFLTQVHIECGSSLDCEYKWESLVGHAVGSQEGGVAGSIEYLGKALKMAGGILCPSTAELDAAFSVLFIYLPAEIYISE